MQDTELEGTGKGEKDRLVIICLRTGVNLLMRQRFKHGKVFDIKELLLIIVRCDVDVVMLKHPYLLFLFIYLSF